MTNRVGHILVLMITIYQVLLAQSSKTSILPRAACLPESLKHCSCTIALSSYTVDCSDAGLNEVPKDIPQTTTHLIMDNNNINVLPNGTFLQQNGLLHLIDIGISSNGLTKISEGAFLGLPALETLNLFNNSLEYSDSLPKSVFVPLAKTLKILDIRKNLQSSNTSLLAYPTAVTVLQKLVELRMDGIDNRSLPIDFGSLKHLQKLIFTKGRDVYHLAPDMFNAIKGLEIKEINMADINIKWVTNTTFSMLKHLQILDLNSNRELGMYMLDVAESLRSTAIQRLRLNRTSIGDRIYRLIDKLCKLPLKELLLDGNGIYSLESKLSTCFPKLEILSIGENYIYEKNDLIYDFYGLHHLEKLNISWQQVTWDRVYITKNERTIPTIHICETGMSCPVILPPNMKWVEMSHFGLHLPDVPELVVMSNTTLKYVGASYTGIELFRKPIYCMYKGFPVQPHVETFDFRNNAIQCFNASMFDERVTHCNWQSLKKFYLGYNKLGEIIGNRCNEDKENILGFLEPLTNLVELDLASNRLGTGLKPNSFSSLSNLEILDLSSNNLNNWTLDIRHMRNLKSLNLTNNNLNFLSKSATKMIDILQESRIKAEKIELDLSYNMFSCICENMDFLNWVQNTEVILVNLTSYKCIYNEDERDIMEFSKLNTILEKLETHCNSNSFWKVEATIFTFTYALITILTMMYRKRHEMRYYALKLEMNKRRLESILDRKRYSYHAFISCDIRDCKTFIIKKLLPQLETKQIGLKFCVAQRNFRVGTTIIQNIFQCMNASKKVIFIISRHFLNSGWCKEELTIAHQMSIERGNNIIICVFMPGIDQNKLPGRIRFITKTVTCLSWPRDISAEKVFWILLQKALIDEMENEQNEFGNQ